MTQALTTLFSLATIVCAFMFEGIRQRGGILIDARFVTVAVFAVCFGIVPIGVQFLEPEQFGPFDWALVIDRAGASFSMATGMGLLGLLVFFRAYKFEWPTRLAGLVVRGDRDDAGLLVPAVALSALAIASISAAAMIGSVESGWQLIKYAMAFRAGAAPIETELLFLRNLVLFAVPVSYLAYGLMIARRQRRVLWAMVLAAAVALSIAGLVHSGGRLSIAAYLAVFAIHWLSNREGRVSLRAVVTGLLAMVLFIAFGKYALWVFVMPDAVQQTYHSLVQEPAQLIVTPLLEFSFPVFSLAHAVDASPWEIPLRWFIDFPLAILTLLPQKLLGLEQPMIIALVNAEVLQHPVPPDLLSTGYYSAGLAGALLMAGGLGCLARFMDVALSGSAATTRLLGLAWSILIGFRVMYGDPTHALFSGLGLIACSVVLLAGVGLAARGRPSTAGGVRTDLDT